MTIRRSSFVLFFALSLTVAAAGCSDNKNPVANTAAPPKFFATLLPVNEVPSVSNADQTGSGTVTITLNTTKDAAGNITAATADFVVTLTGFPNGTTLTGAHIHQAPAGVVAPVIWSTTLLNGEQVLANGQTTFTKLGTTISDAATVAQAIINNPAGFYFNVHSTINLGGCARGQLVRIN